MKDPDVFITCKGTSHEIAVMQRNPDFETLVKDYFSMQMETIIQKEQKTSYYNVYYNTTEYNLSIKLEEFLATYGSLFMDKDIEIRLRDTHKRINRGGGRVSIMLSSGIDWFDADLIYTDRKGRHEKFCRKEWVQMVI